MKKIKYQLLCKQTKMVLNDEGVPTFVEEDVLSEIETDYLESECERIKLIAYNGEYTVEDDGQPEPEATPEERIAELEEALALLLSGVTE